MVLGGLSVGFLDRLHERVLSLVYFSLIPQGNQSLIYKTYRMSPNLKKKVWRGFLWQELCEDLPAQNLQFYRVANVSIACMLLFRNCNIIE